jgi:predicted transposase/invertase (TIGR01784 family)
MAEHKNNKKYEDINLTDAVLFMSVMKHKKACQLVLSILFQKNVEDIYLEEVFVEDDIPNEKGQRAIRLDVRVKEAKGKGDRTIYGLEMQRQVNDNLPKRSRFYQGLMDAPLLKAGKETKYHNLPNTYIIFITEQDFFGLNRTQYTFLNYCREQKKLELGDGGIKIFLNMESKNGNKDLVDLLQYMKDATFLDERTIAIDERILGLDRLVTEVKDSVEWEEMHMTILEKGKEIGKEIGSEEHLISLVLTKYSKGLSIATIADHLEVTEKEVMAIVKIIQQYPDATVDELTDVYRTTVKI